MDNRIDVALEAHRIIAPLLAPNLEAAEKRALREHILMTERISERTLRRMMQKFREGDDATRMVMHGEFYFHQRLPILEDCFRKALLSWGICDTVYLDNGKIFVSKWFRAACTHLGIRHLAAASYSPQSKGKIERFNRTVEEFFEELRLEPVSDLKELNRKFQLWLDESYHKRPHRGLPVKEGQKGHQSPLEAWEADRTELRAVSPEECKAAFLWTKETSTDKTGCFPLHGAILEAGAAFICQKIEARYDPFDLRAAEVWQNGELKAIAKQLEIKEYNGRKRRRGNAIAQATRSGSRLLQSLEKEKKERAVKRQGVISYKKLNVKGADQPC